MKRRTEDDFIVVALCLAVVAIVVIILCSVAFGNEQARADLPRMDSLTATFTADGDCIKAYVLRDPDTGQEYIVTDHGGITPRLDKS